MNCGHANGSAESRSFYPVNSHMYLKCPIHGEQLTILVDRPQGGRTLCDGHLDMAIYSRVAETKKLDEDYVEPFVSGTHYMMITGKTDSFRKMRSLSQEVFHQPQMSFVAADFSSARWPLFLKKQVILSTQDLLVMLYIILPFTLLISFIGNIHFKSFANQYKSNDFGAV